MLADQIRQLDTHLRKLAGSADAVAVLEEDLLHATPEGLVQKMLAWRRRSCAKEAEQTDAVDKRGRLRQQLQQLERSEELSRLRLEEQALVADFRARAEEWSALRIAAHLIDMVAREVRAGAPSHRIEGGRTLLCTVHERELR